MFFLDSSAIPSNPKRLGSATEMVFLSTRNRISVMQADAMKSSRCSAHPRGNSWEGRDTMIVLKKGGGLLQSDVLGIFAKGLLISDHILRTCVGASQESGQGKPCRWWGWWAILHCVALKQLVWKELRIEVPPKWIFLPGKQVAVNFHRSLKPATVA